MKNIDKRLLIILISGLILRLFFTIFIAPDYFLRSDFYCDADSPSWLGSFISLIKTGSYTAVPGHEYGYFLRMPGYSYFLGLIYYLVGSNPELTFQVAGWVQIFIDVISIWLVYKAGISVFRKSNMGLIVAVIYAAYPFIIVWNPVAYSESISVFLMLLGLYFLTGNARRKYLFAGLFLGLGVLFRPQIILLLPFSGLFLLNGLNWNIRKSFKPALMFFVGVLFTYGLWPISNYVFHKKIILTQDLRAASNWDEDVIAFMQYTYSVKTEWEPQFSNILHNKKVRFPDNAYFCNEDSLKLERVIQMSKDCGTGFSHWHGYWKDPINDKGCTKEIAQIYKELRDSQIKNFPWNFYLYLPLQNLKKAVFKSELYDTSGIRKYASMLFYYRTFLIIAGVLGALLLLKQRKKEWLIFLAFPIILYLTLCFGTGVQFRNIEVRYFLHADIILLFPAAYFFGIVYDRFFKKTQ